MGLQIVPLFAHNHTLRPPAGNYVNRPQPKKSPATVAIDEGQAGSNFLRKLILFHASLSGMMMGSIFLEQQWQRSLVILRAALSGATTHPYAVLVRPRRLSTKAHPFLGDDRGSFAKSAGCIFLLSVASLEAWKTSENKAGSTMLKCFNPLQQLQIHVLQSIPEQQKSSPPISRRSGSCSTPSTRSSTWR